MRDVLGRWLKMGGTIVMINPGKRYTHNVAVDGVEVGYPHHVLVDKDGLVWDAPTNTWGQNIDEYFARVSCLGII